MIRRHTISAIVMHWVNAVLFLTLLGSGFALMSNPVVQPVGMWWPHLWEGAIGAAGTLTLHIVFGLMWVAAFVIFLPIFRSEAVSFLREIFNISIARDMAWCMGKGLQLVLGGDKLRSLGPKLGLGSELSPQGFYNAGQKMMAVAVVACGLGLAASGILLLSFAREPGAESILQVLLLIHFCCAGAMAVLVPVHIYMAALAPGEGPALRSMLTGFVPEEFARHHNPLWHDALSLKKPAAKH